MLTPNFKHRDTDTHAHTHAHTHKQIHKYIRTHTHNAHLVTHMYTHITIYTNLELQIYDVVYLTTNAICTHAHYKQDRTLYQL